MTRTLRSTGVTPLHRYYGAVRPYQAHRYFDPVAFPLPSRPEELHLEPLTEPYVNLSIHTARAIHEGCRLPPFCRVPPVSR
jgi:hypothetical protein